MLRIAGGFIRPYRAWTRKRYCWIVVSMDPSWHVCRRRVRALLRYQCVAAKRWPTLRSRTTVISSICMEVRAFTQIIGKCWKILLNHFFRREVCNAFGTCTVLYGERWSIEGEKRSDHRAKATADMCWAHHGTVSTVNNIPIRIYY